MENKVELLGWYGGDKRACLSAWQSTTDELGLDINDIPQTDRIDVLFGHVAKMKKKTPLELINMLAKAGHHTPFEKMMVDFQLTAEIASHIHSVKHRIAQINSESARYKELIDKYYIPKDWNIKAPREASLLLNLEGEFTWGELLDESSKINNELYHLAAEDLKESLGRKRAKETARFFLQYNKQLNYDFQMNWRSFMNFQNLRNSPHAQVEIKEIAEKMLDCVRNIEGNPFKMSLEAFGY